MIIEQGTTKLPILFSVPHGSAEFGAWSDRTALTIEQQLRFSDYGTSETVPTTGHLAIKSTHSRGIVDLNRHEAADDIFRTNDFAQPTAHSVWKVDQEPDDDERQYIIEQHYKPYHRYVLDVLRSQNQPLLIVDWYNTAPYQIGVNQVGSPIIMPAMILSNNNGQTCDPIFLELLAACFKEQLTAYGLPNDVYTNLVFQGGYITKTYSTRCNQAWMAEEGIRTSVESLQIEYSTALTHDAISLTPRPGAYDHATSIE